MYTESQRYVPLYFGLLFFCFLVDFYVYVPIETGVNTLQFTYYYDLYYCDFSIWFAIEQRVYQ